MAFFLFSKKKRKSNAEKAWIFRFGHKKDSCRKTKAYGENVKNKGDFFCLFRFTEKGKERIKSSASVQPFGRQEIERREKEIAEEKIEG